MASSRKGTGCLTRPSIVGRKVAVLLAGEVDRTAIDVVRNAAEAGGATIKLIAPRLGEIKDANGNTVKVDHSLPTVASVLSDAVFIPGGKGSVAALRAVANAVLFVKEAYKHGKTIAASDDGVLLMAIAARSAGKADGKFAGPGIIAGSGTSASGALVMNFIEAIAQHRFAERADLDMIVA